MPTHAALPRSLECLLLEQSDDNMLRITRRAVRAKVQPASRRKMRVQAAVSTPANCVFVIHPPEHDTIAIVSEWVCYRVSLYYADCSWALQKV